ncbi:MAG: Rrf2 family transcriptional regulator [Myxococcales bacterium]|nr:Rrf2 family transcriptional regulator [Myxococcales bacterium]
MRRVVENVPRRRSGQTHLLSRHAEYALLAMLQLADGGRPNTLRGSDLAARIGAPRHYLLKTLRRLVRAKLLVAQRGHGGGYALARPATSISFCDVLAAVGQQPLTTAGTSRCRQRGARCPVHGPYRVLSDWAERQLISGRAARVSRPRRAA